MKATLDFNLPEEDDDLEMALKAKDFMSILIEIDRYLKSRIKYPSDSDAPECIKGFDEIRLYLRELMMDRNIDV